MSTSTLEHSRAELALRHSPLPTLRKLSLEETQDVIVISGKVPSYYLKQLAQETVRPVLAGRKLLNRVQVTREQRAQG